MAYEVDETDRKIIDILTNHAEYSVRKIAQLTKLPITTVHRRLRKLVSEKIIKNYTVNLDYHRLGKGFLAYVMIDVDLPTLKKNKKTQHDIVNELMKFYFVEEASVISGRIDILAKIRAKDAGEFDKFLIEHIQPIEGLFKTDELIVLYKE